MSLPRHNFFRFFLPITAVTACLLFFFHAKPLESSYLPVTGSNIGIGTSSPVGGFVVMNGNVGIGTWSPIGQLEVRGGSGATRIWTGAGTNTNAAAAGELYVEGDLEVDGTIYGDGAGLTGVSGLTVAGGWSDGGTNVYTSTTTDNVGIGTTTPSTTLEIVKQGTSAPLMVSATATGDGDYLIVNSAGNIGIGTQSPIGKLDVRVDGTSGFVVKNTGGTNETWFSVGQSGPGLIRFNEEGGTTEVGASGSLGARFNIGALLATSNVLALSGVAGQSGDLLRVDTNGTGGNQFVIKSSGNVGIGTASPFLNLDVKGAAVANVLHLGSERIFGGFGNLTAAGPDQVAVINLASENSDSAQIWSQVNGLNTGLVLSVKDNPEDFIDLRTGNAISRLYVSGTGNVGIGTTTPVGALTVMSGNVGIGTWSPIGQLEVKGGSGATRIWTGAGTNTNAAAAGELYVEGDLEVDGTIYGDGAGLTGVSGLTVAGGWTDGGTNVYTSTTTDNVGIGTTTPTAALLVENAGTQDSFRVNDAVLDGTPFVIDAGGNIGIGTTSFGEKLTVSQGNIRIDNNYRYLMNSTFGGISAQLKVNGSNNLEIHETANLGDVYIGANSLSTLVVNRAGNVGIGTTSPNAILDINLATNTTQDIFDISYSGVPQLKVRRDASAGDTVFNSDLSYHGFGTLTGPSDWNSILTYMQARAVAQNTLVLHQKAAQTGDLLQLRSSSGTNGDLFTVSSSGSVGIGTGSPTERMQVVGTVAATAFVGDGSGLTNLPGGASGWTDGGTNVYTTTTTDNVGIGTTTPSTTFEIVKQGTQAPLMVSATATGDGDYLIVNSAGLVGVGTINPEANLQVNGRIRAIGSVFIDEGDTKNRLVLRRSGSVDSWGFGIYHSNHNLNFTFGVDGDPDNLGSLLGVWNYSGNLGVGTNSPSSRLAVMGGVAIGTSGSAYLTTTAPLNGLMVQGNVGIGTTTPEGGVVVMNGNVGIGTWSPTQRLQVVGTVDATAFVGDGSGLTNLPGGASGWVDGGTNVYQVTTTDLVGIGTTTPSTTFEIVKQGSQAPLMVSATATGDGDYLIVTSSGNVGIGTTTPVGKFIVANGDFGVGTTAPANSIEFVGSNNSDAFFRIRNINPTGFAGFETFNSASNFTGAVAYGDSSSPYPNMMFLSTNTGDIGFSTGDTYLSAGTIRMIIKNSGNVGIGTTTPMGALTVMSGNVGIGTWSPTQRLQVIGTVAATAFVGDGSGLTNLPGGASGWSDGGTNVYTTTTTDNVGIGTTTPTSTLEVVKTAAGAPPLMVSTTATSDGDLLVITSDGNVGIGTTTPVAGLAVMNGNVGIGTWSPTQKLQVVGTVAATAFVGDGSGLTNLPGGASGWTDGGTNVYTSDTTDNVGIGTTTPTAALLVENAGTQDSFRVNDSVLDGSPFIIDAGGNVGIGTTEVGSPLNIFGLSGTDWPIVRLVNSTGDSFIYYEADSGSFSVGVDRSDSGKFKISIGTVVGGNGGGNDRVVVETGGNVGIGTTTPVAGLAVMSGNVGIGTWSPTQRLQVVGTVSATAFVGDGSGLTNLPGGASGWTDGGTNVYTSTTTDNVGIGTTTPTAALLVENAGTQDSFRVNDAVLDGTPFVIDAGGNVGIGTTAADQNLHVKGSSDYIAKIQRSSSADNDLALLGFSVSTVDTFEGGYIGGLRRAGDSGGLDLLFGTNTGGGAVSEKLRITGAGNVGIGTTTPVGALTVMNGNVGIGTWSPTQRLQVIGTVAATAFVGDGSGLTGLPAGGGWTDGGTNVYTSTTTDLVAIGTTTPISKLTVKGNVGIGTTTPYTTIAAPANGMIVEGNVGIGTFASSGGKLIVMGGNVGIGSTNPGKKLEIADDRGFDVLMRLRNLNSQGTAGMEMYDSSGGFQGVIGYYNDSSGYGNMMGIVANTTDDIVFVVGDTGVVPGTKVMTIKADSGNVGIGTTTPVAGLAVMSGNVGIGTWSPTQRLQVIGTVAATAFVGDGSGLTGLPAGGGWSDGGTNVYTSTTTDLVAIGTTTPVSALTVKGNVGIGTTTPYTTIAAPANGMIVEGNVGIGTWAASDKLIVMGGNVGIGTTSPASRLGISGDITFSDGANRLISLGTTAVGNGYDLSIKAGNGAWPLGGGALHMSAGDATYGETGAYINLEASSGHGGMVTIQGGAGDPGFASAGGDVSIIAGNGLNYGGNVYFSVGTGSQTIGNVIIGHDGTTGRGNVGIGTTTPVAGLAVMNGNVGIGTWSPGNRLAVVGNIGIGTTLPYRTIAGPNDGMVVEGNVGIGTWNPGTRLQVGNTASFVSEYDNGTQAAGFTVDWNNGNKQRVTLGAAGLGVTFTDPSGGVANLMLVIRQDGSGSRTITSWPGAVRWPGGTAPVLTTTAGAVDIVTCYYDRTNYYCTNSLDFQ